MVKTTPTVQLSDDETPVRLAWYKIDRYGKPAGEVLTAFELFLVSISSITMIFFDHKSAGRCRRRSQNSVTSIHSSW